MCLAILLLPFALTAQKESKSTEQFVNELNKKVPQFLLDFSIPGAAIALIEDGKIVLQKGYGFSNIEKEVKVTTTTGFNIGSISKNVATWGIMKLVHEGKIDLDVPIETYLTRWHLPESEFDSDKVTIRRLLSHMAGTSLYSVSAGPPYDNLPTLEEWLVGKNNGLGRVEIIQKPGSEYRYSGGGFGILQLIIEEVTGQTFENYMQAQILDPLRMNNSSYKIDDKIRATSASPYDKYSEETDFELFTVQAGAGLHTNLEDFTRFTIANLYQHKDNATYNSVLPTDVIQQMMKPESLIYKRWKYGLGYQILDMGASFVFSGHGGSNEGWHANFWVDSASNDGIIVLTNGGGGAGSNICNQLFSDWITWKTGESLGAGWNPIPPISVTLKRYIDEKGIKNLATTYATLKKEQPDAYNFDEGQLNELGYYYIQKNDFEKATALFKLNVEAFPNAYNVYDSYGEVLLAQGAKEEAIENYKKSIKLNPGNENGVKVLNGLGISNADLIKSISIAVDTQVLAGYVGRYQTSTGETITINQIEDQLTAEMSKQRLSLIARSTARFRALGEGAVVTFFTATTGQKGLWTGGKVWRKISNTSVNSGVNEGLQPSTDQVLTTDNFLVFRNKPSWGRLTDFENVLVAFGSNYEQQESSTMANLDLSSYDVIIIPGAQSSEFYNDYISNVKRFDAYVAKGGTLVLELNGAEKNKSFKLPLEVTIAPHKALENAIIASNHPIFFPLAGKRLMHARYASNGYLQNVPRDALILAVEAEGTDTFMDRPTFIQYQYGKGWVIAANQCFHDQDDSGRGPLMESVISHALTKSRTTKQ